LREETRKAVSRALNVATFNEGRVEGVRNAQQDNQPHASNVSVAHYVVYGRELGRSEKLKTTSKHDLSLPIMRSGKVGPFFIIKRKGKGGEGEEGFGQGEEEKFCLQ
jgi:hypothetical protein